MKTEKNYRIDLYCEETDELSIFETKETSMYQAFTTANLYVKIYREKYNKKVEIIGINRLK